MAETGPERAAYSATRIFAAGFLMLAAVLLLTLLSSFVLAELGVFSRVSAFAALTVSVLLSVIVAWKTNAAHATDRTMGWQGLLLALMLLAVGLTLYLPASEYVLGGWDPGIYVSTGATIARHGGINFQDTLLASLNPEERELFTARRHGGYLELYTAWRLLDPPDGDTLSPRFFHMYPVALSLAQLWGGLKGSLCVNAFIAIVCALAFFRLCHVLGLSRPAFIGSLLFAVCPVQIWMARFPNSELMAQMGFLMGFGLLFLSSRTVRTDDPRSLQPHAVVAAVLSAGFFGIAQLARPEFAVFSALLLSFGLASLSWSESSRAQRQTRMIWCAVLAATLVHTYMYKKFVAQFYFPLPGLMRPAIAGSLAAGAAAAVLVAVGKGRIESIWRQQNRLARGLSLLILLAAVVYASLVRPQIEALGPNRYNFLDLARLVSWPVMIAAVLGAAVAIATARRFEEYALWGLGLLATAALSRKLFMDPFYLWAARRFMPIAIPFVFIACFSGVDAVCRWTERLFPNGRARSLQSVIVTAFAALALVASQADRRELAGYRDLSGMTAFLGEIAGNVPTADLIVADYYGLADPLHFVHDMPAVCLKNTEPENIATLETVLAQRLARGQRVFVLTTDKNSYTSWNRVALLDRMSFQHKWRRLNKTGRPFPKGTIERGFNLTLSEATLSGYQP